MPIDLQTAIVLAILLLSTMIRSTFGFGDALVAMPLLALLIDLRVATPVVALLNITMAVSILIRSWRSVNFKSARRLILSSIAGIPLGLFLLRGEYDNALKIVLGVVIVGFSTYVLTRPSLPRLKTERTAWLFGLMGGVLGGAYNTNGPPIIVYGSLRHWSPETFRATLQGYFLASGVFITIGHATAGLWTRPVLRLYLMALPVTVFSIVVGTRISRAIPPGKFDRYVHILLIAVGVLLLGQTVRGMFG